MLVNSNISSSRLGCSRTRISILILRLLRLRVSFQLRRPNVPSRIWQIHARIDARCPLHWFPIGPHVCGRQHALPVRTTSTCPSVYLLFIMFTGGGRRNLARRHLKQHEIPLSFTSFPRLGASGVFTEPYYDPADAVSSHSLFLPQEITNPHARFP